MKLSFLGHFGHDHPQALPRKGYRKSTPCVKRKEWLTP